MMMTSPAYGIHNTQMNAALLKRYVLLSIGSLTVNKFFPAVSRAWRNWLPIFFFLPPLPALAWNAAGHRLVASIAWEHLDTNSRSEVSRMLYAHPDYGRWLKQAGGDNPERVIFIEASTWPDEIRKDKRFFSAGTGQPTPTLSGFPDMERRLPWHYVNRPLDGAHSQAPTSGLIDKQLVTLAKTLGTPGTPAIERSYALPWLIHLVGDAHQPLHTSIRLDAEGKWDKLGNGLMVINPFNPHKHSSTLHAFWDDLPGPSSLRGDRLDAASLALKAMYPRPGRAGSSAQWIEESWRIARASGYPDSASREETPTISKAFYENSRAIAERRIVEAGYRLADVLNRLLLKGKKRD